MFLIIIIFRVVFIVQKRSRLRRYCWNCQRCKFNINRSAVWEGAIRGFQRVSYDPNFMIFVKFSDDMGKFEEGIDLEGPRREFFMLLMETITRSRMFEGKENSKNLALDSTGKDYNNNIMPF